MYLDHFRNTRESFTFPSAAECRRVAMSYEQSPSAAIYRTGRKWLTVEAGYYTVVMLPDGGMRKEAKSVSFAKMDQTEFSDLYRAVFGVCWRYVLSKQFATEEEAENACAQLMGFAG